MASREIKFGYGGGIGTSVAVVLSWSINHSIGWAILHGFFGWFYLLYYWLGGGR